MPRRKAAHPTPKAPEKLSEWMREGFKHYEPLERNYSSPSGFVGAQPTHACPIGCATLAKHPAAHDLGFEQFRFESHRQFPELQKQVWITPTSCPDFFRDPETNRVDKSLEGRNVLLRSLITWLNDATGTPRERIADIVEQIGY